MFSWDPVRNRLIYEDEAKITLNDCRGYRAKCLLVDDAPDINFKFSPLAFNAYPKKIIYNGPATIVFWDDGTKTVVKRAKKEKDNKYNAFCAALAKKLFGNNSRVNAIVKSGIEEK